MNILCFPKNCTNVFFCDPCVYATVQKFRLLDYVILLHAAVLGKNSKGLVSIWFQYSSFLVCKAYMRKANARNHNKS